MRKIALILSLLATTVILTCSKNSGSDIEIGYVDQGLSSEQQLIPNKSYSVAGVTCSTSDSCGAIIFSGELNDLPYTGFAAGLDAGNPNFSCKVYWLGGITDTTGTDTTYSGATVVINSSTYTGDIILGINTGTTTANDSSTVTYYTIEFRAPITVGTYNITAGNSITAYKY